MNFTYSCIFNLFLILKILQVNSDFIFPTEGPPKQSVQSVHTSLRGTNYKECVGSKNNPGFCVKIHNCQDIWKSVREESSSDVSLESLISARRQCGELDATWVCCEPNQIEVDHYADVSANIDSSNIGASTVNPISSQEIVSKADLLPKGAECYIDTSVRIFGGKKTGLGEFPWLTLLEYTKKEDEPGHHCGGSLINSRYVLTAAHCVKKINRDWKLSTVRLGEHDIQTNPDCVIDINDNKQCAPVHIDISIEKTIVHEDYNARSTSQSNDIALLRLSEPVNYTKYIRPICLPTSSYLHNLNLTGIPMEISGWGKTESGYTSTTKLKANVDVVSLSSCNTVYSEYNVVLDGRQLCAGGARGVDSCNGDSGGPLIGIDTSTKQHSYYLAGIVSFGPSPCGLEGWPGVYTNINPYIKWIQENLEP